MATPPAVSYHIANLLEKMSSADKDFRFMATNDLMSELQKDSITLGFSSREDFCFALENNNSRLFQMKIAKEKL